MQIPPILFRHQLHAVVARECPETKEEILAMGERVVQSTKEYVICAAGMQKVDDPSASYICIGERDLVVKAMKEKLQSGFCSDGEPTSKFIVNSGCKISITAAGGLQFVPDGRGDPIVINYKPKTGLHIVQPWIDIRADKKTIGARYRGYIRISKDKPDGNSESLPISIQCVS